MADWQERIRRKNAEIDRRDAQYQRPPSTVRLGPLTTSILDGSAWEGSDNFPSDQAYADETERVLAYATTQGVFEEYRSRLRARRRERNAALNELRIAYFLHCNSFRIVDWVPAGAGNRPGEYVINGPTKWPIHVEVKGPTWQSELSEEQLAGGRQFRSKYRFEGSSFDNAEPIQASIEKAYGQLSGELPNLLVIADDLFVPLSTGTQFFAQRALYEGAGGYFVNDLFANLSGVAIFSISVMNNKLLDRTEVDYGFQLFLNPFALRPLPEDFAEGFHGFVPPAPEAPPSLIIIPEEFR